MPETGHTFLYRVRFVLIGLVISALFWVLEAALHVHVFHDVGIVEQIIRPERHEVWMRLTVVFMFVGFSVYAQGAISARRRAEQAVEQAYDELNQIFETAADGMRLVDRDFTVTRANNTFCTLIGLPKHEILGRRCHEVFKGSVCATPECPLMRILAGEERVQCDAEKIRADGRAVPCIVTATPFRGPGGEILGIVEDYKDISDRKKAEQELLRSQERLRNLALHLQIVREEERTTVAREIHDELGQALTALILDAHWLARNIPAEKQLLRDRASAMTVLIETTIKAVKRISHDLRPSLLDDFGLSAAMEWHIDEFSKRTGLKCSFVTDPEDIQPDPEISTALFRIFQETLTNIACHAKASRVDAVLRSEQGNLSLSVRDNGVGIRTDQVHGRHSLGLLGMRERAKSFGGFLGIQGEAGKGTTIEVVIPAMGVRTHDQGTYCR